MSIHSLTINKHSRDSTSKESEHTDNGSHPNPARITSDDTSKAPELERSKNQFRLVMVMLIVILAAGFIVGKYL